MAVSFSQPDPSSPAAVSAASFSTSRRGFDPAEVRDFLRMVSVELARSQERERFLEREIVAARTPRAVDVAELDEETITNLLGEETARVLTTAREAANQMRTKAEEAAGRLLREAQEEAARVRADAELEASRHREQANREAEAELDSARHQGREMVEEARDYRDKVVADVARRRESAREQLQQLAGGRDRIINAFDRARLAANDVIGEMNGLRDDTDEILLPAPAPAPAAPIRRPVGDGPTRSADRVPAAAAVAPPDLTVTAPPTPTPTPSPTGMDDMVDVATPAKVGNGVGDDFRAGDLEIGPQPGVEARIGITPEAAVSVDADRGNVPDESGGDSDPDIDHDRLALVVDLFAPATTDPEHAPERTTAEDVFARLRAARPTDIARQVMGGGHPGHTGPAPAADAAPAAGPSSPAGAPAADEPAAEARADESDGVGDGDDVVGDPLARRDEAIAPIVISLARRLKRVMADEQNDVLDLLRRREPILTIDTLLPTAAEQLERYSDPSHDDLLTAAVAGTASISDEPDARRGRRVADAGVTESLVGMLATELVEPMRERIDRATRDAGGDNTELANHMRGIYREWKTQRLDELTLDLLCAAYSMGVCAASVPGSAVRWVRDPAGPTCTDPLDVTIGKRGMTVHHGCRCVATRHDG